MPIYDYLCTACDHRADILHGLNDPGPNFCPSCGAEGTMRKQFAAPAVHFKGSGWAKKDRGGSGASKAASAKAASRDSDGSSGGDSGGSSGGDSGGSSGGDSGGSSGSETKPASGGSTPAASPTTGPKD